MRNILFAVIVFATCSVVATAQDTKAPMTVLSQHGDASATGSSFGWGPAPAACKGCLFYGGDVNPTDPNVQGFANGDTLLVPMTTTYGAVTVPATGQSSAHPGPGPLPCCKYMVSGIFFNNDSTLPGPDAPPPASGIFDPPTGTYDIRIGLSSGNGGTSVASGSGPQTAVATGRMPFGLTEYTTTVKFTSPITATNGTTYWINESPQCTDSGNTNCSQLQYFLSNTTQQTGNVNGKAQPAGQLFFNSAFFGFTWINWCDPSLGQNTQQCAFGSFGVLGQAK